jgi:hypothetical protein
MELIEFIQTFADKDGKKANPIAHSLPPDFPQYVLTTVTLKARGKTKPK